MNLEETLKNYVDEIELMLKNELYLDEETWFFFKIVWARNSIQEKIENNPDLPTKILKKIENADNKLKSITYKLKRPLFKSNPADHWCNYIIPKMPIVFSHEIIEKNLSELEAQGFSLPHFESQSLYPNFFSSNDPDIKYQLRLQPEVPRSARHPRRHPEAGS